METSRIPVSFIVLTQDEEANVDDCLQSIAELAGEVFIVDSGSTDRTLEIAGRYTNKIFHHPFENYSIQRNWAQANLPLTHEWVFHIDADERVSPELALELGKFFGELPPVPVVVGLLVSRRIEFMGKPIRYGGVYPTYHCRLYRKGAGRCEDRGYDQHFIVEGPTSKINGDLVEVTAFSLYSWTARHNRWAQMEARQLLKESKDSSGDIINPNLMGTPIERRRWVRSSIYGKSPMFYRAFANFIVRYFLRGGFLDGTRGLIYHFLHGFWFRFYVDACIYELRHLRK